MKPKEVPCKIGTIPFLVYVDRRGKIEIGRKIRVRDATHGSRWFSVIVDDVHPDGHFHASKI